MSGQVHTFPVPSCFAALAAIVKAGECWHVGGTFWTAGDAGPEVGLPLILALRRSGLLAYEESFVKPLRLVPTLDAVAHPEVVRILAAEDVMASQVNMEQSVIFLVRAGGGSDA